MHVRAGGEGAEVLGCGTAGLGVCAGRACDGLFRPVPVKVVSVRAQWQRLVGQRARLRSGGGAWTGAWEGGAEMVGGPDGGRGRADCLAQAGETRVKTAD